MSDLYEAAKPLIDLAEHVASQILSNPAHSEDEAHAAKILSTHAEGLFRLVTVQCELCAGDGYEWGDDCKPTTTMCKACNGKGRVPA